MSGLPELAFEWRSGAEPEALLGREWLVTNGLGGYASGTLAGCNTRRYHGMFIPTLPGHGRTVLLPKVEEHVRVGSTRFRLDGEEQMDGSVFCPATQTLRQFRLEGLIPRWEYQLGDVRLSRRVVMVHGRNTVFVEWRHHGGPEVSMVVRPWPAFRFHDRPITDGTSTTMVRLCDERVEFDLHTDADPLRLCVRAPGPAPFVGLPQVSEPHLYRIEQRRGLDHAEHLKSPGYFEFRLREGERAYFTVSIDPWCDIELDPAPFFDLELERERRLLEHAPPAAREGVAARLVLAADQFIIDPSVRPADAAWSRASGQDARSVIAGYHWFTDWGRDTMIALDGLCLQTGRFREAAAILRTFNHYVRDGLLPNLFPEGGREGLYHTADATLWFFHAIERYLEQTGDEALLKDLFPTLESIVDHHVRGTHFNIGIDPADGLLTQGQDGYQLTWMDAKVDGWVVTPRRGKTVELNALWFNAVSSMAQWAPRVGAEPVRFEGLARRAQQSFNARFWNPETNCLFDIVDKEGGGDDPAIRPNQVFSISLRHPVLDASRWRTVMEKVEQELLTPFGLRTLSRQHPDYKRCYDGDLRARDAAYHQGTVWPWLMGHFVDAFLKVTGDKARARALLEGLDRHLSETGVGQISEIFDAEPPFHARGCVAQAWSIAETLRSHLMTAEQNSPRSDRTSKTSVSH